MTTNEKHGLMRIALGFPEQPEILSPMFLNDLLNNTEMFHVLAAVSVGKQILGMEGNFDDNMTKMFNALKELIEKAAPS